MNPLSTPPTRHARPIHVLVADDDPFWTTFLEVKLTEFGAGRVTAVRDGHEALRALHDPLHAVDLFSCDLRMPGMDGVETIRHLADAGYAGGLLLMSGASTRLVETVSHLVVEHGLNLVAVLRKPPDLSVLAQAVYRCSVAVTAAVRPSEAGIAPAVCADELEVIVAEGRYDVAFQPKLGLRDGRLAGAECLLRWRRVDDRTVTPPQFVALAERYGLMRRLTRGVIRKALQAMAEWSHAGLRCNVSVNVLVDDLADLSFPDDIEREARNAGVPPGRLTLEVTESQALQNFKEILNVMSRVRLKGFDLSIDDFGTGYSNLLSLKQLPCTELKVDRAFVSGALADETARVILESSLQLGRKLGMRVVAEGAETVSELELVTSLGFDEVQGYVIARPMPAADFLQWALTTDVSRLNPSPRNYSMFDADLEVAP